MFPVFGRLDLKIPTVSCSNLSTFFDDGFDCNVATHDEGMRLLAGLVVLFPVVPFSEKTGTMFKKSF